MNGETVGRLEPFRFILTIDFYDGPESGLAILSSGEALRFRAIADSHSRLNRAYEFAYLVGSWASRVELRVGPELFRDSTFELWFSGAGGDSLEHDMLHQDAAFDFVGVATTWLKKLIVAPASRGTIESFQAITCEADCFRAVHRYVKEAMRSR